MSESVGRERWTRRRLLRGGLSLTAAGVVGGGVVQARYRAPYNPVLQETAVFLPRLPSAFDGLRIVQLSDLHVQPGFPATCLEPALRLVESARPDLIVLTGDYQYDHSPTRDAEMRECISALRGLARMAPLGVFAVYGNHDYPTPPSQPDESLWRAVGITTLRNATTEIWRGGERLFLIGLDSAIARPASPYPLTARLPRHTCSVALWHEPDRALETAMSGVALQLSGHTHGGQVVLPFVGPPILPPFGRLYPSGLFQVRGMALYVSRGVGLLPPLVRVNCPSEVSLLTLRCGDPPTI